MKKRIILSTFGAWLLLSSVLMAQSSTAPAPADRKAAHRESKQQIEAQKTVVHQEKEKLRAQKQAHRQMKENDRAVREQHKAQRQQEKAAEKK